MKNFVLLMGRFLAGLIISTVALAKEDRPRISNLPVITPAKGNDFKIEQSGAVLNIEAGTIQLKK
jgi:hypothetical protein